MISYKFNPGMKPDGTNRRVAGDAIWIDGRLCKTTLGSDLYFSENTFQELNWGSPEIVRSCEIDAGTHYVEVIVGTDNHYTPSGTSRGDFYYLGENINVAPLPCVFDLDQVLVVETFRDESTISTDKLSFPFVKFCGAHPALVVDVFTLTSFTDFSINSKLKSNVAVKVPNNKVYSIFYVAERTSDISVACDINKAYNKDSKMCENVAGFVTVCREGYYDSQTGYCNTSPDLKFICPEGSSLNANTNECIILKEGKVVEKPGEVKVICPEKSIEVTDRGTTRCVIDGIIEVECPAGSEYAKSGKCISTPEVIQKIQKPIFYIPVFIFTIGLILVVFGLMKIKRRKL